MTESAIDEQIEPLPGSFDPRWMARREPALPMRFRWRGRLYVVSRVLESWKETGPCRSGSDEQYVREHLYRVRTTCGKMMTIYFRRQPRTPGQKREWRVRCAAPPGEDAD